MFLTQIHHYYGGKVMILWDGLPAHVATQTYFERERPDWFLFEYFPGYSPDLNPVEQCWNMMKNVFLANFVPITLEHLREKALEVAKRLDNDPKLLAEFFHHAKLKL
jgi:transposase